jgi:hypothetical protein
MGDVLLIIEKTLPKAYGQRNRRLFWLARELKQRFPLADPCEFNQVVREWHRQARPNIRTLDFIESWGDFVRAWHAVEDLGGDGMEVIATLAADDQFSLGCNRNLDLVARVFRAGDFFHRGKPLYMDLRRVARLSGGLAYGTARSLALQLVEGGLLEVVAPGVPGYRSGRATVWRWCGG